MSDLHTKRVEEKENLSALNERLQAYVMRCKEMNEVSGTLEEQLLQERNRYNSELKAIETRLKSELATVRGDLSFATDQNDNLKRVEKEQHEELVLLRDRLKKLEPLQGEVVALRAETLKQESENKELSERLASALSDANKYKESMDKTMNEHHQTLSKARVLAQENKSLEKERDELVESREAEMNALRTKAAEVLHNSRADWKHETDVSLAHLEEKLKAQFEQTVEQQSKHMKELHVQVKSGRAELAELSQSLASAVEEKQEIATLLKKEEDAHQASSLKMQKELDVMDAMVNGTRSRLVAKEEEFHTLMDAKIALENEIVLYKAILDKEEERMGGFAPKRKRGGAKEAGPGAGGGEGGVDATDGMEMNGEGEGAAEGEGAGAGAGAGGDGHLLASKRQRAVNAEGAVLVVDELCLKADRVTLLNVSDQEQALGGYKLKSLVGAQEYAFPETLVLPPHGRVTVWAGKKNKGKHNPPSDLFWTQRYIWNNHGDTAVLLNGSGEEVSRFTRDAPRSSRSRSSSGRRSKKARKGEGYGETVQETSDLLKDAIGFGGNGYPAEGGGEKSGECCVM